MASMNLDDAMNTCSVYFTEEKEKSYEATATHSHWVNYTSQNGGPSENFAQHTEGNKVDAFLGGKRTSRHYLMSLQRPKKRFISPAGR